MTSHSQQSNQRPGTVTALILIFSIVLMLLGMGTLRISMHERNFAIRSAQIISAKSAADAGLTRAVYRLNRMMKKQSVDLSLLDVSGKHVLNSDATYDFTVNTDASGAYQIESTGHSKGTARTVRSTLKLKGLFEHVILVKNTISLSPGSDFTAINTSDPFDTDLDISLATASTAPGSVPIGPGTVINGDVYGGVGSDPAAVITGSGTITGEQSALTEEPEFPVITPPSFGITQPTLGVYGVNRTLTPADSGRYENLILGKAQGTGGKIEITGGQVVLHITSDVIIGGGCEFRILSGGSVVLYLDGSFTCESSAEIQNYNTSAKSMQIFATGSDEQVFELQPKTKMFGLLYAPNASVNIWPNAEIVGAVVADNLRILSTCTFTYDKAVEEVSIDDPGVRLVLDRWSE
jgi:hypothetical protein